MSTLSQTLDYQHQSNSSDVEHRPGVNATIIPPGTSFNGVMHPYDVPEPQRSDYPTHEDYLNAYEKWLEGYQQHQQTYDYSQRPYTKMGWSAVLGAITGGATAVSSYLGTKDTNTTNKNISDDTNAMNYQIWREQRDYDEQKYNIQLENEWKMYNQQVADSDRQWKERFDAENAYNSPANQRALLEEAGYNPNIYGGDATSSGGSSSVNPSMSQPAWNSAQPPTMQGYQYQSPLSAAVAGQMDNLLKFAQAFDVFNNTNANRANTEAQTSLFTQQGLTQAFTNKMNEKYGDAMAKLDFDIKRENYSFMQEDNKIMLAIKNSMKGLYDAQKIGQDLSNEAQRISNKYLDGKEQLSLMQSIVTIQNGLKQGYLTEAQARLAIQQEKESVARAILTYNQNEGVKLDNKAKGIANNQAEQLVDQIVWSAKLQNLKDSALLQGINLDNTDKRQRNDYFRVNGYGGSSFTEQVDRFGRWISDMF